ncbi:hypothetical protein D3C80_1580640 [compost metagenome]
MGIELHGVAATQKEVGDHQELRGFQGPDRRIGKGLADRGIQQHRQHGEDQVHGEATDDPIHRVHRSHEHPYDLRHATYPRNIGYSETLVEHSIKPT